ncbi:MAG: hypothetical protein K2H85_09115, partial [Allobaculum sp.]|nr:hypothetical protein [Allobaculum sp.]
MNRNQPTTYADLNGASAESLDSLEMMDSSDSLSAAYADLGKAFYEYRFEEPTPELLLYFDRITELLKTNKDLRRQRNDHMEPMSPNPKEAFEFTSNSNSSNSQSFQDTNVGLASNEPSSPNNTPKKEVDSWNPNSSNGFNSSSFSPWEEPEDLKDSFLNQTYNQNAIEQQQTFVAQPQFQQSSSSQEEKKKRGFSPFRKKEKDHVSSFDELPDMKNNKSKFSIPVEATASQPKYCSVCHNPVG